MFHKQTNHKLSNNIFLCNADFDMTPERQKPERKYQTNTESVNDETDIAKVIFFFIKDE
jgi:hypothetical protein